MSTSNQFVTLPDTTRERLQDELRERLGEELWSCAVSADVAQFFIQLKDDAGLEYAGRRVVSHARVILKALAMLKKLEPPEVANG